MKFHTAIAATCIALFGAIAAASADAATFYVATTGSNTNAGTEAQPWATGQYAASHVGAGDVVIFEDGTYDASGGTFSAPNINLPNGTAANPVTFKARNKCGAVLDHGTGQGAAIGSTHDNTIVEGFEVIGSGPKGVTYWGAANFEVRDMCVHGMRYNAGDNTEAFRIEKSDGGLIENNLAYDVSNDNHSSNAACFKLYYSDNLVIRGNECHTAVSGVKFKEHEGNVEVTGNVFHDLIGESQAITLNSQTNFGGRPGGAAHDVLIADNIAYNVRSFVRSTDTAGNAFFIRIVVRNNTTALSSNYHGFVETRDYAPDGIEIYDNIFYAPGSPGVGDFWTQGDPAADVMLYMDHNLYSDESGTVMYSNRGGSPAVQYKTFSEWNSASGFSANAIVGDPLFVNAAGHDYRLQTGSPAIGAGRFGGTIGASPANPTDPGVPPAAPSGVSVVIE